jgi:hypothetical protein
VPHAQWLIVILLTVAATLLVRELAATGPAAGQVAASAPSPTAASTGNVVGGPASSAGAGGVFAIAGQITRDNYGLYLVDLENATICVYQYFATERSFRLVAARTFRYDRMLDAYNTQPDPREVARMVGDAVRLNNTTTQP